MCRLESPSVITPVSLAMSKPVTKSPWPQRRRAQGVFALTLLAAALAGCGGGGGDSESSDPVTPPVNLGVAPSLGAILQANVSLVCAPSGASLGTGSTGDTGQVTIPADAHCSGPVLVTVSGKSDNTSTYYDEALAAMTPFPAGSSLRAVLPSLTGASSIAVTPLTEIAAAQALASAGSLAALSTAQAQAANSAVVGQVLGSGVSLNILTPPTLWTGSTAAGSLGNSAADTYAYYLASLARMASGAASPALAVTAALAADLADGVLNGTASGSFVYSSSSLAGQLADGMRAMSSFANPDLQNALGVAPAAPVVVSGFSPASGAVGSTVTITGSGFDTDLFHMSVLFSRNVAAEIVSGTATELVVKVPDGAISGPLTVTHTLHESTQSSASSFTVTGGGNPQQVWTSRASPSNYLLNGLTYGQGSFVAVGYGTTILNSADGISWSSSTAPDADFYQGNAVIWDGSRFIMVGDSVYGSPKPALIATSTDGLTWTRRNWTSSGIESLVALAADNGVITAAGMNGSLLRSTDGGSSWSSESQSGMASFTGLAAHGGTRVAVGRNGSYQGVILVNTGAGWTSAATALDNFAPYGVIWAGDRFLAVGGDSPNYGANAAIMTSPDGVTWSRLALPTAAAPAGFKLAAALWTGSKIYATGDNGNNRHLIVSSADGGATWAQEYEGQGSGNGVLAAIASSGTRIVTVGGVKSVTLP